ncbi:MAG: Gfo/Idh/MocA family oxidoreductase [Promethearchaeota archaeon]
MRGERDVEVLRFGVLGAGHSARNVARGLVSCPKARLAGVYNRHVCRATELVERVTRQGGGDDEGNEVVTSDQLEEFLVSGEFDAVVVCTPHHLHHAHALAALDAGLHVLCEKPLSTSFVLADEMVRAARDRCLKLGAYHQRRLNPTTTALKRLVNGGDLGVVSQASTTVALWRDPPYYSESDWRGKLATEGGGVLINQAIHWLDLLVHLFGYPIEFSCDWDWAYHDVEVEDSLVARLRFPGGTLATFSASTCAFPGFSPRVEVFGSQASARLEGGVLSLHDQKGAPGRVVAEDAGFDAHQAIVADFASAIETDGVPVVPGEEGALVVRLVEEMYGSRGAR